MKRVVGLVAFVACASCGALLGTDEDPTPPKSGDATDGGGDGPAYAEGGSSVDGAPSDGTPDGAQSGDGGACKLLSATCASAGECCSGGCNGGKCCVAGGNLAANPVECCSSTTFLAVCEDGGQVRCCPPAS